MNTSTQTVARSATFGASASTKFASASAAVMMSLAMLAGIHSLAVSGAQADGLLAQRGNLLWAAQDHGAALAHKS